MGTPEIFFVMYMIVHAGSGHVIEFSLLNNKGKPLQERVYVKFKNLTTNKVIDDLDRDPIHKHIYYSDKGQPIGEHDKVMLTISGISGGKRVKFWEIELSESHLKNQPKAIELRLDKDKKGEFHSKLFELKPEMQFMVAANADYYRDSKYETSYTSQNTSSTISNSVNMNSHYPLNPYNENQLLNNCCAPCIPTPCCCYPE